MKKLIIWISVISLVVLGSTGMLYRYAASRDFFFDEINELVEQETGYTITKSGPLEFSLVPRPTLTARRLTATNSSAPSNPTLAEIGSLSFALHWSPLLRRQVVVDLKLEAANIDLQIDTQGKSNWMTEELQAVTGGLPFGLERVDASEIKFVFRNHQTNEILGFDLEQIDIDLSEGKTRARIDSAGRFGGSRFFAVGNIDYESDNNQLDLELVVGAGEARDTKVGTIKASSTTAWIEQNAPSFPLNGVVQGTVSIEDGVPRGELEFKASVESLDEFAWLAEELSYLNEGLGPVAVSGILQLNGSDFDIGNLQLGLRHKQLEIGVDGSIQNLLSDVRFDLDISAQAESLRAVVAAESVKSIAEKLVAQVGPVDISASVRKEGNDLLVSELDLGFAYNSFSARVGGDLRLMQDDLLFELDLRGEATDTTDVLKLLGVDDSALVALGLAGPGLLEYGSLNVTARVTGENDSYQFERVSIQLQDGNISSTVAGNLAMIDDSLTFDLDSSLAIKDMSHLAVLFPEEFEPDLQGLGTSAKSEIKGTLTDFSLNNMEIDFTQEDRELHLRGRLSQLPDNLESKIDFRFITDRPIELEQYFPKLTDLQLTGPLDLAGTVNSSGDEIRIQQIKFQAEKTDVSGDITVDLSEDPPRIIVKLKSRQFETGLVERDPEAVLPEPEESSLENQGSQQEPETQAAAELSEKELGELFEAYTAGIGIETAWINDLNLYVSFIAGDARIGAYELENLVLILDAGKGVFSLDKYEVMLEGKPLSIKGSVNTNTTPPTYKFSGMLQGDSLEALLNIEENLLEGGELGGGFKFTSKGDDVGELIENLDGEALITMGPLTIRSNALNIVSADILSSMLKGILSKKEDEPTSSYQCGVLGVEVKKGVARADRTFTLQAKDYNLAGKGEIDLNTGFVDIAVYPKARKGIGFSISTLVGGFKIKGHLATPEFGVRGGGLITAAVAGYALAPSVAAASATNPVTATIVVTGFLAKGFFDRLTASSFTCENTIKRIERRRSDEKTPNKQQTGKRNY